VAERYGRLLTTYSIIHSAEKTPDKIRLRSKFEQLERKNRE
jgi:hypothetical protein